MFSKSLKFKSLVSGFLVIVPVLLSAAVHAENCPDPLSMEFQAGPDGQTGKYVVPGTDWKSNEGYQAVDISSYKFSEVSFFQRKDGNSEIAQCKYIMPRPNLASAKQMAKTIVLNPPVNNKSTISGEGWMKIYENDLYTWYSCDDSISMGLPNPSSCKFTLSFEPPPTFVSNNPFAKK